MKNLILLAFIALAGCNGPRNYDDTGYVDNSASLFLMGLGLGMMTTPSAPPPPAPTITRCRPYGGNGNISCTTY